MTNTFNAENFRNVFAQVLAMGGIASEADAIKRIDEKCNLLLSLGCDRGEVTNLGLDMADMAKGHFEVKYPRYVEVCESAEIGVMKYPGDVLRFYCTRAAWQYSPAAKSGAVVE